MKLPALAASAKPAAISSAPALITRRVGKRASRVPSTGPDTPINSMITAMPSEAIAREACNSAATGLISTPKLPKVSPIARFCARNPSATMRQPRKRAGASLLLMAWYLCLRDRSCGLPGRALDGMAAHVHGHRAHAWHAAVRVEIPVHRDQP